MGATVQTVAPVKVEEAKAREQVTVRVRQIKHRLRFLRSVSQGKDQS